MIKIGSFSEWKYLLYRVKKLKIIIIEKWIIPIIIYEAGTFGLLRYLVTN